MSFHHLCSSPSSLLHDPLPLCNLLSVYPKSTPRSFFCSYNPNSSPSHSRNLLQATHVSVQEAIPQETRTEKSKLDADLPLPEPPAASKSYVWVNPKSPRASQLRRKSYDSRYSSLIKLSESLDACKPNDADVCDVITGFGGKLFEQDLELLLRQNPQGVLLQQKWKPSLQTIVEVDSF